MSLNNNFDFAPVEIGMMSAHALPNDNWLPCDGSIFSEQDYPELYKRLIVVQEKNVQMGGNSREQYLDGVHMPTGWGCCGEKYLNGQKIRVFSKVHQTYGGSGYDKVGVDFYAYNNSNNTWEKSGSIRINSSSAASTNESAGTHFVSNVYIRHINGYYVVLLKNGYYNSGSQYKNCIYTGTSLSNLSYKGHFDTDSNGYWIVAGYRDSKYYFLKYNLSDQPSAAIYYATDINASYNASTPTYIQQYNNQTSLAGGGNINCFYDNNLQEWSWAWFTTGSSITDYYIRANYKYKSSNSWQYYSTIISNSNKYMMFGKYLFPIETSQFTYLLSVSGLEYDSDINNYSNYTYGKLWYCEKTGVGTNSERSQWIEKDISNIISKEEVVWGAKKEGDNLLLSITEKVKIVFGIHQERPRMKIISVPISDFLNNDNRRVRIVKDYGYAYFESSSIEKSANSNGVWVGLNYWGGGYEITNDYGLCGANANSSLSSHTVDIKKGVLPKVAGMYIRAR